VPEPGLGWQLAGDADAAGMLVATLTAEWGAQGLRINALEFADGLELQACMPLLDYVAGPSAPSTGMSSDLSLPCCFLQHTHSGMDFELMVAPLGDRWRKCQRKFKCRSAS
jgi:hypothetical protein